MFSSTQSQKQTNELKVWSKPAIVLERSLEVKAQQGPNPGDALGPFGPLTTGT